MEGNDKKNLQSLDMDELTGVINLYPWFGGARKELCVRMSKVGGSEWGKAQYSEAAMYVASRTLIYDIMRATHREACSDRDVEHLIKEYIGSEPSRQASVSVEVPEVTREDSSQEPSGYRRTVRVAGGDFFSPEQYAAVRRDEDNVFSRFRSERSDEPEDRLWEDPELGFCTETLAAIYADQGYAAEAKKIYSRLVLRYPEKSAYFASLIEKLRQEN